MQLRMPQQENPDFFLRHSAEHRMRLSWRVHIDHPNLPPAHSRRTDVFDPN
jgi:hypothetical protein